MHVLGGWLLGLTLGMRHALEPDHLAALSTLVSGTDRSPRRGALLGAFWGAGHTASLLGVGVVLALLEARMPPRIADAFELGVAFMLLFLGARALISAARAGASGPAAVHSHGDSSHAHAGAAHHVHVGGLSPLAVRPLLVGLVHGLAGSGALTAWALAELPTTSLRLAYIGLFGLGSVLGMALLSGAAGWPLAQLTRRPAAARALSGATGLLSLAVGVFWGLPLLQRLFAA